MYLCVHLFNHYSSTNKNLSLKITIYCIAEIVTFWKWMIKTNILKTQLNPFQHYCPNFLKPLPDPRHAATSAKRNSNFQLKQHLIWSSIWRFVLPSCICNPSISRVGIKRNQIRIIKMIANCQSTHFLKLPLVSNLFPMMSLKKH